MKQWCPLYVFLYSCGLKFDSQSDWTNYEYCQLDRLGHRSLNFELAYSNIWGPISRYPVTCACLCGLVEGWVPVDASSGYLVIDWVVETRRWGARWWPWWCLGGDMPHWIEIAIVFMNWLITLYCFYFYFLLTIVASA